MKHRAEKVAPHRHRYR